MEVHQVLILQVNITQVAVVEEDILILILVTSLDFHSLVVEEELVQLVVPLTKRVKMVLLELVVLVAVLLHQVVFLLIL